MKTAQFSVRLDADVDALVADWLANNPGIDRATLINLALRHYTRDARTLLPADNGINVQEGNKMKVNRNAEQMPTVDTAFNWLSTRWLANDATNLFALVSAATKKALADARAEIAATLTSDEERLAFYKFCSRCGVSDSPDWETSRARASGAA